MKRCLTMLIIREIQIKATSYHITQSDHLSSKKLQITDVDKDIRKRELSCTVGENENWWSLYEEQYGGFSEIKK